MALFDEFRDGAERFRTGIEHLKDLLRKHNVDGVRRLVELHRSDTAFRLEWNAIWKQIALDNGGKVSLGAAGAILGAALGGAGIVALGGAIGVPLLAVLGLAGLVAGAEVDSAMRKVVGGVTNVELPNELHERLRVRAIALGVDPAVLLVEIVETSLHEPDESGGSR